ncbi:MAG: hypothetical protein Ct9H300mP16_00810 [Pseudomonadota bacterium]|nr:MAG: hypothetical protein Ct9H300mP16_00810 [Pseudomonadota bacterium]
MTSDIPSVPGARIDAAAHPALLMVDTISSLGSMDYRHDEWGIDVTIAGSQKGLMLPPGLGFNAISDKALGLQGPRHCLEPTGTGRPSSAAIAIFFFPYTPATNLLFGLREAGDMLFGPKAWRPSFLGMPDLERPRDTLSRPGGWSCCAGIPRNTEFFDGCDDA